MAESIAWVVRDMSGVVHRRHRHVSLAQNAVDALTIEDPVERQRALCAGGPSRAAVPTAQGLIFVDLPNHYVLNASPYPLDRRPYAPAGNVDDQARWRRAVERMARDQRVLTVGAHAESTAVDRSAQDLTLRPSQEDVIVRLMARYGSHLRSRIDDWFGLERRVYEVELPVSTAHPFNDAQALLAACRSAPSHGIDLFDPFVRLDLRPFSIETLWWDREPMGWLNTLQQRLTALGLVWTDEDLAGWVRATAAFRRHLGVRPLSSTARPLAVAVAA